MGRLGQDKPASHDYTGSICIMALVRRAMAARDPHTCCDARVCNAASHDSPGEGFKRLELFGSAAREVCGLLYFHAFSSEWRREGIFSYTRKLRGEEKEAKARGWARSLFGFPACEL